MLLTIVTIVRSCIQHSCNYLDINVQTNEILNQWDNNAVMHYVAKNMEMSSTFLSKLVLIVPTDIYP